MVKVRSIIVFVIVAMVLAAMAAPVSAGNGSQNKSTDKQKYIVVFNDQGKDKKNKAGVTDDPLPGEVKYKYKVINAQVVELTGDQLEKVKARKDVKYVEPDAQAYADLNDIVPAINATIAWSLGYTGRGVNVSVIDSGIDATHPDLTGKVILWKNFLDNTSEPYDDWGHGTHVADIIAGSGSASGGRYTGVAPGASLFNAKVLDSSGIANITDVIAAIDWSVENQADVISLSLSSNVHVQALDDAVHNATMEGVIVVCSAGNTGPYTRSIKCPSDAPDAITVGSVDMSGNVSLFSSRGPTSDGRVKPDIVTYGEYIISARATGTTLGTPVGQYYTVLSGTSMACPQASAACAILLEADPDLTPVDLKNVLLNTAARRNGTNYPNNNSGWGVLDVWAALDSVLGPPTANFSANQTSGNAPLTVQFTDTSKGATNWAWDFNNDGIIDSTARNPGLTFTQAGLYTVKLSVTNTYGADDELKEAYINVTTGPVAGFTSNVISGNVPLTVQFTDTSTNAMSWAWDFNNDGIIDSSTRDPSYTYMLPGTYSVRLYASNSNGTDDELKTNYITVVSSWKTYVPNYGGSTVSVINQSTDTVTATITTGYGPYGIAFSPDGTLAYVAVENQNKVTVISTATDKVVSNITVGRNPHGVAMSSDGRRLYVGNYGSGTISVVNTTNTSNYTLVGSITGITRPHELWVSPDGSRLYVSTYQSNNVYVINTANDANTIVSTITGSNPYFISLDPSGTRLFVANYNASNITVYDASSLSLLSTINTAAGPESPIVSPDGSRLYYVTSSDNKLTIAYANNYTVIKTVTCGSGVRGIACSPDGSKVYVTNMNSGTTSIVNVANDAGTTKTVRVGSYPYGLGQFAGYYPVRS